MPKVTAAIAALVLAITLTGCTTAQTPAQELASAPQSAEQPPEGTPAPLVAEEPTEDAPTTPEGEYVSVLRAAFERDGTQIPNATDEQLISAGQDACGQMDAGKSPEEVRVVEGETIHANELFVDSARIAYASLEYLCP